MIVSSLNLFKETKIKFLEGTLNSLDMIIFNSSTDKSSLRWGDSFQGLIVKSFKTRKKSIFSILLNYGVAIGTESIKYGSKIIDTLLHFGHTRVLLNYPTIKSLITESLRFL